MLYSNAIIQRLIQRLIPLFILARETARLRSILDHQKIMLTFY